MKYTLIIEADINDGDYITEESVISKETVEFIKDRIIPALKEKGGNWPVDEGVYEAYKGVLEQSEVDRFEDLMPHSGEQPVHSINSVKIAPEIKWKELY